ncbi:hypothetical protein HanIR_Chr07g0314191 [Helianthus annuus]|nr:hypothetical protein HanIR_Chr07g0314191 [Helianthus annuus]
MIFQLFGKGIYDICSFAWAYMIFFKYVGGMGQVILQRLLIVRRIYRVTNIQ